MTLYWWWWWETDALSWEGGRDERFVGEEGEVTWEVGCCGKREWGLWGIVQEVEICGYVGTGAVGKEVNTGSGVGR